MSRPSRDRSAGTESASSKGTWRIGLIVLALGIVTYGYFYMPAAWNEVSRYSLVRSIVERGRFDIDPYHELTGDKALSGGHYYSDKAPGTSFAAVPAYALNYGFLSIADLPLPAQRPAPTTGTEPSVNRAYLNGMFVASFFSVGLSAAAALWLFFATARAIAVDRRAALLATLAWGFGTLSFPYATLFYGHQLCASLLFLSFALLWSQRRRAEFVAWRSAAAGAAASFAVVVEYPAVVAAAALLAYLCSFRLRTSPRDVLWFLAGALPGAALLAWYHTACFGAPWRIGYGDVATAEFAEGMSSGVMGVTYPDPGALLQILFGQWRGYLFLSPIVFAGAWGLARMWRSRWRHEAVLAAALVVYYLLLNSAYYMWWGGAALGARHTIPMLPFLLLPLSMLPPGRGRAVMWCVLAWSIGVMVVATAIGPEPPEQHPQVLAFYFGHLVDGNLAVNHGSSNLGLRMGLPGYTSLLPLAAVWIAAGRALWRWARAG